MPAPEETSNPSAAPERVLVEQVAGALADEGRLLDAAALAGDPPDPATLVAALREHATDGSVIACVGVLERLADFIGVVETLVALAAECQATIVLALPNDAFAVTPAGERVSAWSEGAVAELRGLLPADHVALHMLALRGAALVPAGGAAEVTVTAVADARPTVPVGFVLAFGPRAHRLAAVATVATADLSAERAHEHARTAELEVLRALCRRPVVAPAHADQP